MTKLSKFICMPSVINLVNEHNINDKALKSVKGNANSNTSETKHQQN